MTLELQVQVLTLIQMPRQPVWTRLGFRESQAAQRPFPPESAALVEQFIAETRVRVFFCERPFRPVGSDEVDLGGYQFASRLVRERFGNASAALVMGASALPQDAARIAAFEAAGELERAVVLDAVLSEKTDYGLDFVEQEIASELRRTGRTAGRRLSAGYGDFSLSHQKFFYDTLEFGRHGIGLNERFILSPEKSVTALLPIYSGKAQPQ